MLRVEAFEKLYYRTDRSWYVGQRRALLTQLLSHPDVSSQAVANAYAQYVKEFAVRVDGVDHDCVDVLAQYAADTMSSFRLKVFMFVGRIIVKETQAALHRWGGTVGLRHVWISLVVRSGLFYERR